MATKARRIALGLAVLLLASPVACRSTANDDECEQVSKRIADLQVTKDRVRPFGRLLPPFDGESHAREIWEESHAGARARCAKGWKRVAYECMMKAADLAEVERCRGL